MSNKVNAAYNLFKKSVPLRDRTEGSEHLPH